MFRSLLISSLLVTLATAQCSGSVNGLCPVGTTLTNGVCCSNCEDKLNPNTGRSDCPNMASFCTNSAYQSLMKDQCKKTCGFCSSVPTTTTTPACFDKINPSSGISDCPRMATYCTNSAYASFMSTECRKTCGYCR